MKNRLLLLPLTSLLLIVSILLTNCSSTTSPTPATTAASTIPASPSVTQVPSPTPTATTPLTRTVVDATGAAITIPYTVNRVADAWNANNGIVVMLGAANKLVATTTVAQAIPWLQKIDPQIKTTPAPFGSTAGDLNLETLIASHPDVLLSSAGWFPADTMVKFKDAGIPVVQMPISTFDDLKTTVTMTGQVLGPQEAAMAADYNSYLDANIKRVTAVTTSIPAAQRPTVLHTSQYAVLSTDGANSLIDAWINYAGGVNVAAKDITGNQKAITAEQIAAWNPDIVIVGTAPNGDNVKAIMADPKWSSTNAVKNKKVVANPTGVYLWDRYSSEEALQVLWAAKLMQPDKFTTLDVAQETKAFYAKYFHYNLTDADVTSILNAVAPQ